MATGGGSATRRNCSRASGQSLTQSGTAAGSCALRSPLITIEETSLSRSLARPAPLNSSRPGQARSRADAVVRDFSSWRPPWNSLGVSRFGRGFVRVRPAAWLTKAETAFAGRAYAAYGGIYIAASPSPRHIPSQITEPVVDLRARRSGYRLLGQASQTSSGLGPRDRDRAQSAIAVRVCGQTAPHGRRCSRPDLMRCSEARVAA